MLSWRGRIGYICPPIWVLGPEYGCILPEGVNIHVITLGLYKITPEEMQRVFDQYMPAAKRLAQDECDVIIVAGTPIEAYMGYDRMQQLLQEIGKSTGIPTTSELNAAIDALKWLSAKRIVIATPYEDKRNEERRKLCEKLGFEVLNIRGLGLAHPIEFMKQPPYATYRLAKQAFLEAPDCDAIWISCPVWGTVRNIEKLEHDVGKPVVTAITSVVWTALRAMQIKEPIKGYGKLLEMER